MTKTYKKKLIEVAIPLEIINKASAKEKSIRQGHPSSIHQWWARRPLVACRAILFSQLVDDPSEHSDKFPTEELQEEERQRLFRIIADLVEWKNSTNDEVLDRARTEIRKSCDGILPPIYDPFSGSGSIPMEAQRLGLPAFGSDLNPVAVLIGKATIEIPATFQNSKPVAPTGGIRLDYQNAEGFGEDIKYYGSLLVDKARTQLGKLYPNVKLPPHLGGNKANVISWIWARTVPSPDPVLNGLRVPLVSSFVLSSKKGKEVWVDPVIEAGKYSFTIKTADKHSFDIKLKRTVGRKGGVCLVSKAAMPLSYIREQGVLGNIGVKLMAIVAEGASGRVYVAPSEEHEETARSAEPTFYPSLQIALNKRDLKAPIYGMKNFGDLFTSRQLTALGTLSNIVIELKSEIKNDAKNSGMFDDEIPLGNGGKGALAYAEAITIYLSLMVSKLSDLANSLCNWEAGAQCPKHMFGRHAIPMVWDFAEGNILSSSSGSLKVIVDGVHRAFEKNLYTIQNNVSHIRQSEAETFVAPDGGAVFCTDPPYYDNIDYADLSDFFFIWLKQTVSSIYPELFSTLSTPKIEELVAMPHRHGTKIDAERFFLGGMKNAIANIKNHDSEIGPLTIFYAFKQSEIDEEGVSSTGWATFLSAVMEAGYSIHGTWPIRTENASRMTAQGSNALASSVVLVCRKKKEISESVTRAEFIRALKNELPKALERLQETNITPADMPQSSIGPGIGIYSRYDTVLESDDSPMTVKTALQIINRELDEYFSGIEGEFDTETRFTVNWFEQNGLEKGDSGTAINLAQARGISVDSVEHAGIIEYQAGKVRILSRDEMKQNWSPESDTHLTHWECCQYLIRTLENDGELEAAVLVRKMGNEMAEAAKDVAYRLYDICNKKGWAKEGTSYNGLIAVWSDLTAQAATISDDQIVKTGNQMSML